MAQCVFSRQLSPEEGLSGVDWILPRTEEWAHAMVFLSGPETAARVELS